MKVAVLRTLVQHEKDDAYLTHLFHIKIAFFKILQHRLGLSYIQNIDVKRSQQTKLVQVQNLHYLHIEAIECQIMSYLL